MAELTLKQRGAYNSLLDLLYSRDGNVPDDDVMVARMMSCHWREWGAVKKELFATGKVWVEDGKLRAKRVQETISDAVKHAQQRGVTPSQTPSYPPNDPPSRSGHKSKKVNNNNDPPLLPIDTAIDRETRSKKRVSGARKPRATPTRIPENFDLDEDRMMFAVQRGFEPSRARILFEAFSNHHRAKGTTMLDWSAAWRTWVLNEIKFKGPPQHTTYGAPRVINGNTGPRGRKSLSDIKREGEERLRQMENRGGLFEHDHEIDL